MPGVGEDEFRRGSPGQCAVIACRARMKQHMNTALSRSDQALAAIRTIVDRWTAGWRTGDSSHFIGCIVIRLSWFVTEQMY